MQQLMRRDAAVALASLLLLAAGAPRAIAAADPERLAAADSLFAHARTRLQTPDPQSRRAALTELERASRLDPARAEIWLWLGRTYLEAGEARSGRSCLARATALAPDDADAHLAAALAWRWNWLCTLERAAFAAAETAFARAAARAPSGVDAWLGVSSLALVRGDAPAAMTAALNAYAAAPGTAEAVLAVACAAYRLGALDLADSLFRVGLQRLPAEPLERLTRAAPVDSAEWRHHDPDLTTPENEAELNYLARAGHALLLFRERDRLRWDARAELVARYGLPADIDYDPFDRERYEANPLDSQRDFYYPRRGPTSPYVPDELAYPFNVQVWHYPALGMTATLWDRSLTQSYDFPYSAAYDTRPRPDPALLAGRTDLVVVGDGVYRALPPRAREIKPRASLARFPIEGGTRIAAFLGAPGGAADTLWGAWAVATPEGAVVARGRRRLAPSACEPARLQVAEFSASLPPGDYRLDVAVSDTRGGRGLAHLTAAVGRPSDRLEISDLVAVCREGALQPSSREVRLDPRWDERLRGSHELTVYFEVAELQPGADGSARFSYTYAVRRPAPPGRPAETLTSASSETTHAGTVRRQFVTVPLGPLPPGEYDLVVEVRDQVSGAAATRSLRFTR
jgi:hypothetical protein